MASLGHDQGVWGRNRVSCLEGEALGLDMKCLSRQWAVGERSSVCDKVLHETERAGRCDRLSSVFCLDREIPIATYLLRFSIATEIFLS